MNPKASLAFYDVLVSLFIFLIIFTTFFTMQTQNRKEAYENIEIAIIYSRSSVVFEQLTKFSSLQDTNEISLVSKPYVIDNSKLSSFSALSYDSAKEQLKMPVDFKIEIGDSFSFGSDSTATNVFIFKRSVLLDNNISEFVFKVFK